MSNKEFINAIIYTDIHDELGPNPVHWYPADLSENIRMLVSIKAVTLLSGSYGYVPDSLIIFPFPSIKLKGIVKYIERANDRRRGKSARSAITFLFKEVDDLLFYKYISYLETLFTNASRKIIDLEKSNADVFQIDREIFQEIDHLRGNILELLEELRKKELRLEEFPDAAKEKEIKADYKFKLVVVGDPGVGKTSTILRFTDNAFSRVYLATAGTNISDKSFQVDRNFVELIIWDIAGQAKFGTMRKHFYQGANGVILIYDLTNPKSFESISAWYKDIRNHVGKKASLVGYIFGNKLDLIEERKVKTKTAQKLANALNLNYIEISALTGQNVENSFYNMAKRLIQLKKNHSNEILFPS
ncbi:MAG: GTP-binding protein [Promethearchaeota archaeon]